MRMRAPTLRALLLVPIALLAHVACGQPLVVDDTGLVPGGALQVEAWHHNQATWLAPSMQIAPGLDLIAGTAWMHAGRFRDGHVVLDGQSKWQVRSPEERWSAALVGGLTAAWSSGPSASTTPYAYAVLGGAPLTSRLVLYANAGWTRAPNTPSMATWGLRADAHLRPGVMLAGEVYGTGPEQPGYQVGLRLWPWSSNLELDLLLARDRRSGTRATEITLGIVGVLPLPR